MDEYNQNYDYQQPQDDAQYTQPVYQAAPVEKKNQTLGIIALACGIASVVFACCCGLLSFPLAIAAVVCAFVEKNKTGEMSLFAKIGMGIAAAGFLFGIINSILSTLGFMGGFIEGFNDSYYGYGY